MPKKSTWIRTYSGAIFYPLQPEIDSINIIDIAHSLSLICRYLGHIEDHYSVVQHSWIVSNYFKDDIILAKWGLLHDAPEAYICDIPRPIKPQLIGYTELEEQYEKLIAEKFDLPYPIPSEVKEIDTRILKTEMLSRMTYKNPKFQHTEIKKIEGLKVNIPVISPKEAELQFLRKYIELWVNN